LYDVAIAVLEHHSLSHPPRAEPRLPVPEASRGLAKMLDAAENNVKKTKYRPMSSKKILGQNYDIKINDKF
jgi:hypothetical protein